MLKNVIKNEFKMYSPDVEWSDVVANQVVSFLKEKELITDETTDEELKEMFKSNTIDYNLVDQPTYVKQYYIGLDDSIDHSDEIIDDLFKHQTADELLRSKLNDNTIVLVNNYTFEIIGL